MYSSKPWERVEQKLRQVRMLRPGSRGGAAFGFSFDRDRPSTSGRERDDRPRDRQPPPVREPPPRPPAPGDGLPVYSYRRHILYLVEQHPTLILLGETGMMGLLDMARRSGACFFRRGFHAMQPA